MVHIKLLLQNCFWILGDMAELKQQPKTGNFEENNHNNNNYNNNTTSITHETFKNDDDDDGNCIPQRNQSPTSIEIIALTETMI